MTKPQQNDIVTPAQGTALEFSSAWPQPTSIQDRHRSSSISPAMGLDNSNMVPITQSQVNTQMNQSTGFHADPNQVTVGDTTRIRHIVCLK
jgi:hypothetical protein